MQFDPQKLREAVLYVVSRSRPDELGAVKLNKVLYYADMLSYAFTGNALTGAPYKKRPFGPTSDKVLFALRDLENEGEIAIRSSDYFGYRKTEYEVTKSFVRDRLSEGETCLLDDVIDFVCRQNTAKTISEFSHDASWDAVTYGEEIPYLAAYNLLPNQSDLEDLRWAENEGRSIANQRSASKAVDIRHYRDFRSRVLQALGW